jgi:hypothetical protein
MPSAHQNATARVMAIAQHLGVRNGRGLLPIAFSLRQIKARDRDLIDGAKHGHAGGRQ